MGKIKTIILLLISINSFAKSNTPKITVVMVIDQFANHYIKKLKPHFKYAFKDLLERGIVYTKAFHPHAGPATATGHTALNTGTFAKKHGVSSNKWPDKNNQNKQYEINKNNIVSGENIMVDGLSDQFILSKKPNEIKKAFCLSLKSRAAVGMASQKGKAVWFDEITGNFTTSKSYFKNKPKWIKNFNKKKKLSKLKEIFWTPCYPLNSKHYNFKDISNYKHTRFPKSFISTKIKIDKKLKEPFELFCKTPYANQILLDLAKECINSNLKKKNEQMLLWVSLSSLDPLGHSFGPQSMEVTDMIYHLDKQIKNFINFVNNKFGEENVLFVLTSDHGISRIPELLNEQGNTAAKRIIISDFLKQINNKIEQKYKIKSLATTITGISIFLDKNKLNKISNKTKNNLLADIKFFIKNNPGIKQVWLKKELKNLNFKENSFYDFYKKQIYPSRVGQIIFQPNKYCFLTKHPKGTAHRSCYGYDTHVPLFIYQKNNFEKKTINTKVWMPQLAATLAKILNIPKPSACEFSVLPI